MKRPIYLTLILLIFKGVAVVGQDIVEPVKPEKAAEKGVVIRLEIDTTSFPELAIYNSIRFQIDPYGRKFDHRDTAETWNSIQIKKASEEPGWYELTFIDAQRNARIEHRRLLNLGCSKKTAHG